VVIFGGGLIGSMAAVMFQKRGLSTLVLESRPAGRPQKVVVGEAITEGSSLFLRHEIGLGDWLKANSFRKFGFDFLTLPRTGAEAASFDDCHELLLSLTPLERIRGAFPRLIPTFHVERTGLNAEVAVRARKAGATFVEGASVERVELAAGSAPHTIHYALHGEPNVARGRFVVDASGRRAVLGRQLGITHPVSELDTSAVWNRFENVSADPALWTTFQGVDRRRHTIHLTGQGFWFWWIHQSDRLTSVGVSFDKTQHQPDVKGDDHGFWEMVRKFPPLERALAGARPEGPYQYYAHLPYRSEHWLSVERYAILGDAAWFIDALYSIGIETACRQLAAAAPIVERACRGEPVCARAAAQLNREFELCQSSVIALNQFKYQHGWGRPHTLMQTALYELGEIAELYHMQDPARWSEKVRARHYRLQWSTERRKRDLERFMARALTDGDRDLKEPGLLKKALLPGWAVYGATWPLWRLPHARPWFFILTRAWGFSERLAERLRLWPDALSWMASGPTLTTVLNRLRRDEEDDAAVRAARP
jgi:flavin-dependent dehydrogenase